MRALLSREAFFLVLHDLRSQRIRCQVFLSYRLHRRRTDAGVYCHVNPNRLQLHVCLVVWFGLPEARFRSAVGIRQPQLHGNDLECKRNVRARNRLSYCRETRATLCVCWNVNVKCCTNDANRSCVSLRCTFCNSHFLFCYVHSFYTHYCNPFNYRPTGMRCMRSVSHTRNSEVSHKC